MNVLIACEESQRVCSEFRKLGYNAYSCDIQEPSGGHPEWHIKGDVLRVLNPAHITDVVPEDVCQGIEFGTMDGIYHVVSKWDLIIAHPPCTHLSVSGARHFEKKRKNGQQRDGIEFFMDFLQCDCEKIVVENPVGIISGNYIKQHFPDLAEKYDLPKKPTQIIHPWMFGDNYSKTTCLWIKGLPPLKPEVTEQPPLEWKEWIDGRTGRSKRQPLWYYEAANSKSAEERQRIRSRTFPGIARAMAEQWGRFVERQIGGAENG